MTVIKEMKVCETKYCPTLLFFAELALDDSIQQ
jgi:hypothetical protein